MTLLRRDHLLPVDAEVLPRLVRSARHREAPGDERADVVGPAGLHRQAREVDVGALPHDLLARRGAPLLRRHVHHLHEHRPRVLPRVLQPLRRLGLLEEREQLADFAQRLDGLLAHPQRDAPRRAEEVAEHRNPRAPARSIEALRLLEQQRRAARLQHAVADFGHLEPRVDLDADALQLAAAFELRKEIAEVGVFHRDARRRGEAGRLAHVTKRGGPAPLQCRHVRRLARERRALRPRPPHRLRRSCSRATCCRSSIGRRPRRSRAS